MPPRALTLLLLGAAACGTAPLARGAPYGIETVTFTGAGMHAVELDGYGTPRGPHWPLRPQPPLVAEDVPAYYRVHGAPVAYVAGSTPAVELVARVPPEWSGAVTVQAAGGGWHFTGTGSAAGGVLRARVTADRALPAVVQHLSPWRLRWRARHRGAVQDLGESSAHLYTLLAEPAAPLLHTPLHLAAVHARRATTAEGLLAGVWRAFAARDLRRARDARPLRYYGEYLDGAPAELRRFLVSGTGQCMAWSHLLYAALAAHGVDVEVARVLPPDEGGLLLLQPWRFIDGERFISAGANGVVETEPAGDDVAWIARGRGQPHGRIWTPEPLPIGRLAGDDTLAYFVGRNGVAESTVDTAHALPLLARGFGLEQQRAYELEPGAHVELGGDDVVRTIAGVRFVLTGGNGVLETARQPGMRPGPARGSSWDPVVGQGSTGARVQGALPRGWPITERGGDDREYGWILTTGADGVSQTRGAREGRGVPHAAAIGAGADGVLGSRPAGDDVVLELTFYLRGLPADYRYLLHVNAWPGAGTQAQHNRWPPPAYPFHAIVRVGGAWYDPSYGLGPFQAPLDWERALLAGVATPLPPDTALPLTLGRAAFVARRASGTSALTRMLPAAPPW